MIAKRGAEYRTVSRGGKRVQSEHWNSGYDAQLFALILLRREWPAEDRIFEGHEEGKHSSFVPACLSVVC